MTGIRAWKSPASSVSSSHNDRYLYSSTSGSWNVGKPPKRVRIAICKSTSLFLVPRWVVRQVQILRQIPRSSFRGDNPGRFTDVAGRDVDLKLYCLEEQQAFSKIPSIFEHRGRNSSAIESNYHWRSTGCSKNWASARPLRCLSSKRLRTTLQPSTRAALFRSTR